MRPLGRLFRVRTLGLLLACAVGIGSLVAAYAFIPASPRQARPVAAFTSPSLRSHTPSHAGRYTPSASLPPPPPSRPLHAQRRPAPATERDRRPGGAGSTSGAGTTAAPAGAHALRG